MRDHAIMRDLDAQFDDEEETYEKVSATYGMEEIFTSDRRTGKTTRIVDNVIQLLFGGYKVKLLDHHDNGKSDPANSNLHYRVMDRIKAEHNWLIKDKHLCYDKEFKEMWIDERPKKKKKYTGSFKFKAK